MKERYIVILTTISVLILVILFGILIIKDFGEGVMRCVRETCGCQINDTVCEDKCFDEGNCIARSNIAWSNMAGESR